MNIKYSTPIDNGNRVTHTWISANVFVVSTGRDRVSGALMHTSHDPDVGETGRDAISLNEPEKKSHQKPWSMCILQHHYPPTIRLRLLQKRTTQLPPFNRRLASMLLPSNQPFFAQPPSGRASSWWQGQIRRFQHLDPDWPSSNLLGALLLGPEDGMLSGHLLWRARHLLWRARLQEVGCRRTRWCSGQNLWWQQIWEQKLGTTLRVNAGEVFYVRRFLDRNRRERNRRDRNRRDRCIKIVAYRRHFRYLPSLSFPRYGLLLESHVLHSPLLPC